MNSANNKAMVLAAATFALAAIAANAASVPTSDFLCWTVRDAYNELENVAVAFSYATVNVDGTYLKLYDAATGDSTGSYRAYSPSSGSTSLADYTVVYSGVFDSSSATGIMVELWDETHNRIAWQRYSIESVREHIWLAGSYVGGAGENPLVVSNVVPEPAGGVMVLIGFACLALRRWKRIAACVIAVLACMMPVLAAQNDALIVFSTHGPDAYSDGTTVMDGECYALAWEPAGSNITFEADGSVKGGKLLLTAPVAKDGRCPKVLFEIDAEKHEAELKSGSLNVYLLDTRKWSANGAVAPTGTSNGHVGAVNAVGKVPESRVSVGAGALASKSVLGASVAAAETAVPDGTPRPEITGIRVDGANVYLTVRGTVPFIQYDLASGNAADAVGEKMHVPQSGAAAPEDEIVFVAPAKKGGAFFKVGRR